MDNINFITFYSTKYIYLLLSAIHKVYISIKYINSQNNHSNKTYSPKLTGATRIFRGNLSHAHITIKFIKLPRSSTKFPQSVCGVSGQRTAFSSIWFSARANQGHLIRVYCFIELWLPRERERAREAQPQHQDVLSENVIVIVPHKTCDAKSVFT